MKRPKTLTMLINELVKNFNNQVEELEGLKEDMRLERREFADTLEQTNLSYESSHEEALRREREAGEEKLSLQAFVQEGSIIQLSRQLKKAEVGEVAFHSRFRNTIEWIHYSRDDIISFSDSKR